MQTIRIASLATMFVLVASTPAFAAGLNLSWNDCAGEGGGVQNKQFACDTNAGSHLLVASWVPPHDMQRLIATDVIVEMIATTPTLPQWWNFQSACRGGALTSNVEADLTDAVCEDWTLGEANVVNQVYLPNVQPGTGRVTVGAVIGHYLTSDPVPQVMLAGHEYVVANITIRNQKTLASDCGGCTAPVCLIFRYIKVIPCVDNDPICYAGTPVLWFDPHGPGSNVVTWQGATAGPFAPACLAATPAKRATWGGIKALYR